MKALVLEEPGEEPRLAVREVPLPTLGPLLPRHSGDGGQTTSGRKVECSAGARDSRNGDGHRSPGDLPQPRGHGGIHSHRRLWQLPPMPLEEGAPVYAGQRHRPRR